VKAFNMVAAVSPVTPITRDTMTLEEIARRMDISLTVAYELAQKNKLPVPVFRVGRQYRISTHAYEALMTAQHANSEQSDDAT
jgi:excisionase family DNA binding protein